MKIFSPNLRTAFLLLLLVGLHPTVEADLVVTTNTLVSLNQSATDAIQGLTATVTENTMIVSGGAPLMTDATAANTPTTTSYFNTDGTNGSLVFDLGATGATTRRLDQFDIWLASNDDFRRDTRLQLAVSTDNIAYSQIADTGVVVLPGGTSSQFNQLSLSFGAADAVGFQYLRVTGIPQVQPNDSIVRHARWVELDAFTSSVPEPGTVVLFITGLMALVAARKLN